MREKVFKAWAFRPESPLASPYPNIGSTTTTGEQTMLVREINAFAYKSGLDAQFAGRGAKVVVVLPKDGKKFYVARRGGVTENREDAFVYDYDRDRVADQCEAVFNQTGNKPEVVEA
jgi:hypothetical protein